MLFEEHLHERGGDFIGKLNPFFIDYEEEVVTFPLWTVNGRFVGYQRYFWKADKLKNNSDLGRYYTYRSKEVLTAWGTEFIDLSSTEDLYVVEGVWDAISVMNAGRRLGNCCDYSLIMPEGLDCNKVDYKELEKIFNDYNNAESLLTRGIIY